MPRVPELKGRTVLSIEDRRFYEHPGFDPIGMAGAVISNLRGRKWRKRKQNPWGSFAKKTFVQQCWPTRKSSSEKRPSSLRQRAKWRKRTMSLSYRNSIRYNTCFSRI